MIGRLSEIIYKHLYPADKCFTAGDSVPYLCRH
jgi:hypothetical protein